MAKLSERFTDYEAMCHVYKLGGIFTDSLEYRESIEACREYIQDTLGLDKEQQAEIIDMFQQEIDEPGYMNYVREACGIPQRPDMEPEYSYVR